MEVGGRGLLYTYRYTVTTKNNYHIKMGSDESYFKCLISCESRGILYTYHYTVITRMTPALRWAVMRAVLMFH